VEKVEYYLKRSIIICLLVTVVMVMTSSIFIFVTLCQTAHRDKVLSDIMSDGNVYITRSFVWYDGMHCLWNDWAILYYKGAFPRFELRKVRNYWE